MLKTCKTGPFTFNLNHTDRDIRSATINLRRFSQSTDGVEELTLRLDVITWCNWL